LTLNVRIGDIIKHTSKTDSDISQLLFLEKEQQVFQEVWTKDENRGELKFPPIHIELKSEGEAVRRKPYPVSLEGRLGLQPIIEGRLRDGLLELCMSPYNIPILPVKKPDGSYRLVQDPSAINQIVQSRYPGVPNLYTLFRKIPHDHKWFSVVDLKDAFLGLSLI
jgi:hypothetical protein